MNRIPKLRLQRTVKNEKFRKVISYFFVLTLCAAVSFASVNLTNPPEQVITEVTDEVLTQIRNHPGLQKKILLQSTT